MTFIFAVSFAPPTWSAAHLLARGVFPCLFSLYISLKMKKKNFFFSLILSLYSFLFFSPQSSPFVSCSPPSFFFLQRLELSSLSPFFFSVRERAPQQGKKKKRQKQRAVLIWKDVAMVTLTNLLILFTHFFFLASYPEKERRERERFPKLICKSNVIPPNFRKAQGENCLHLV